MGVTLYTQTMYHFQTNFCASFWRRPRVRVQNMNSLKAIHVFWFLNLRYSIRDSDALFIINGILFKPLPFFPLPPRKISLDFSS